MHLRLLPLTTLVLLLAAWFNPVLAADSNPMRGGVQFEIPHWFKTSFLDLSQDVEEATAAGKRVMLMFHQEGCPYCAKLVHENFSRPELLSYFQQHFEALDINIWGDREVTDFDGESLSEKEFSAKSRVNATPTLVFLDETGAIALRISGYYDPERFTTVLRYVAEKQEKHMPFREYFAKQHAQSKPGGALLPEDFFAAPPHDLAAGADKPLAVFFEQADCPACATLHQDVLQNTWVREQLARFRVVQLNRWGDTELRTPDGRLSSARAWADALEVDYLPSVVLFDQGKEVIRMAALYKAFHFESILDYVASGAYRQEPELQRFLHGRSERLRADGRVVDLWE